MRFYKYMIMGLAFWGVAISVFALEWKQGPNLPYPIMNASSVVARNHIYLFGGYSGGLAEYNVMNKIISAPIQPNGSPGSFTFQSVTLPKPLAGMGVGVVGDTIFVFGGYDQNNFTDQGTCWSFTAGENGTLSQPKISNVRLPLEGKAQIGDGFGHTNLAFEGNIYIIGGEGQEDNNNNLNLARAYVNRIKDGDYGTIWEPMSQTNPVINPKNQSVGVWNPCIAFVRGKKKNFAFQIGGRLHPNMRDFGHQDTTNEAVVAVINPKTGLFDSWRATNPLPVRKQCGVALSLEDTIYVVAGTGTDRFFDNRIYIGTVNPETGDVEWTRDSSLYPYQTRGPCGVIYKTPDGANYIAIFGGHEDNFPWSYYARIAPGEKGEPVPAETPLPANASPASPAPFFQTPPSFFSQEATSTPGNAPLSTYPGIPVPGFHPFEAAQKLVGVPPNRTHVLYFTSSKSRDCANQNTLLQDTEFKDLASKVVFVWVDLTESQELADRAEVFKAPTWIFYDSQGQEKARKTEVLTPLQIKIILSGIQ